MDKLSIRFLGATDTVTGSKYLVRAGNATLLVDCGLFQGWKNLRLRNWAPLPVPAREIDAVVLTHAHIDHSGYIPLLVKQGFRGRVYCTPATRDLCRVMLPDSGGLQEEDADFHTRHGIGRHHPALPLYTRQDAYDCLRRFEAVEWHREFQPVPGVTVRFSHAGHIAGAASALLQAGGTRILFSGDVGRPNDPVMQAPEDPPAADVLLVESTYGDRLHPREDPFEQLGTVIRETAARGGVLVVPAFAVGRVQALLHAIQQLMARGAVPRVPVVLDSPLAQEASRVYFMHRDELRISGSDIDAILRMTRLVETPAESQELAEVRMPMVLIAGSGMATGGRVVHHLKAFAPNPRNTVLLTGFQAGGTRGAALAGGATALRIHGEDVPVRCEVRQLASLSAHADAAELEAWLRRMPAAPRRVFVTHGEPAAADAMRQRIERALGWNVTVPTYLEAFELQAGAMERERGR